jgi:hypothetical protein
MKKIIIPFFLLIIVSCQAKQGNFPSEMKKETISTREEKLEVKPERKTRVEIKKLGESAFLRQFYDGVPLTESLAQYEKENPGTEIDTIGPVTITKGEPGYIVNVSVTKKLATKKD